MPPVRHFSTMKFSPIAVKFDGGNEAARWSLKTGPPPFGGTTGYNTFGYVFLFLSFFGVTGHDGLPAHVCEL